MEGLSPELLPITAAGDLGIENRQNGSGPGSSADQSPDRPPPPNAKRAENFVEIRVDGRGAFFHRPCLSHRCSAEHRSQPLLSCVTILVPICCDLPLAVHSASDSSIPVDPTAPAHSRLTSRSFPPDEAITSKDETRLTDYLRGDAAQTFIDVVYKVRRHMPSLPRSGLIAFTLAIDLSIRLWISQISHRGYGGSV